MDRFFEPPVGNTLLVSLICDRQANVFEVVLALTSAGGFPRRLMAGSNRATKIPMIAITTSNSTRVKPCSVSRVDNAGALLSPSADRFRIRVVSAPQPLTLLFQFRRKQLRSAPERMRMSRHLM